MLICEKCKEEHDGSYGSGRFCSSKCARSFSTSENRSQISKKVSETLKGYKTIKGGKIKLCNYGCGKEAKHYLETVKKWCCEDYFTQCSKIRQKNSLSVTKAHKKRSWTFPKSASLKGIETYRRNLREKYKLLTFEEKPNAEQRRIVFQEQNGKCLICGISEWVGNPLTLHYDHIDGNRKNTKRENVRFICPNCHSQTETYCKGKPKNISDKQLKKLLIETNFNFSKTLESVGLFAGGYNLERLRKISKTIMPV